ncbi:MAG: class I adenylate-forming enzyme family protein [Mycobacterium sp.]
MFQLDVERIATTPTVLAAVASAKPDHPFIVADDGDLSYRQTAQLSGAIAASLTSRGLVPGERVGILLPNGSRWCAALLGAHAAGLCVVPLNTWYRRDELASVARRARLRTIVTQAEIFGHDTAAAVDDLDIDGYLGPILWPVGNQLPEFTPQSGWEDALSTLRCSPARPEADALVLFTSGSSAAPKAVRLTQGSLIRNAHAIGERQGIRADDRFWFASPLFFVFGCANALPNALTHAATLCVQERFEPSAALKFIERQRCSVYYGVAPVTRALAACPELADWDISALRTGTANATPEDLRIAIDELGVAEVCNAYGMTEGYGHTAMTAHTDPKEVRIYSQGTALPTQEVRIVTAGAPAAAGTPGDIQIRGAVTPGYLDGPCDSLAADGWFTTGDIGMIDSEGRLHYLGRGDEMMKVQGINISPLEVESLLVQHDSVDEAFVFGLPTPEGDQQVGCVLVSTVDSHQQEPLALDVAAWLRNRAAAYKVPSNIRVVSATELPLTPTGKVSKRLLKEQTQALLQG